MNPLLPFTDLAIIGNNEPIITVIIGNNGPIIICNNNVMTEIRIRDNNVCSNNGKYT